MAQVGARITDMDKDGVQYELRGQGLSQNCSLLLADDTTPQQINDAIRADAAQKAGLTPSQVILYGGAQ